MVIHKINRTLIINASLEKCWGFFSNPANLIRVTPPTLDFQVLSKQEEKMYPGLMIEYRVRPLLGIPITWLTEITHVDDRCRFVDEQRIGPYRLWHHEHHFSAIDGDRTKMRDTVHYVLPFSPFSEVIHPWLVEPELRKIFDFRETATARIFNDHREDACA